MSGATFYYSYSVELFVNLDDFDFTNFGHSVTTNLSEVWLTCEYKSCGCSYFLRIIHRIADVLPIKALWTILQQSSESMSQCECSTSVEKYESTFITTFGALVTVSFDDSVHHGLLQYS